MSTFKSTTWDPRTIFYRGADMSLARPGRKQANVSVRIAWISFGSLPCRGVGGGGLDDSSRLDVVEVARVPDILPRLFPFLVGLRTYQHPGKWSDLLSIVRNVLNTSGDVCHVLLALRKIWQKFDRCILHYLTKFTTCWLCGGKRDT